MSGTAIVRTEKAGELGELRNVAEAARDFASKAKAANTVRAYRADWADFSAWCGAHGIEALPAAPESVALYVADLASRAKVSTIRRRLVSIAEAHRAAGFESPSATAPVRAVVAGIRREKGSAQTRKSPAVTETLRKMLEALPGDLIGLRDRALLLVGFAAALRRSELVALAVEDAAFSREGIVLTIRRSKTDQAGEGQTVAVPFGSFPQTCPVRTLRTWLEASGISEGPLFRGVTRHGAIGAKGLSGAAVALIVKRAAEGAGLDPAGFAGHSLRAGFVTTAAAADVPEHRIMRQTRHRSRAILDRYIREANLFRKNAAASVGL